MPMPLFLPLMIMTNTPPCGEITSPVEQRDPQSYQELSRRITSGFGDGRRSFVAGHLHAGVDIKTRFGERVSAVICQHQVPLDGVSVGWIENSSDPLDLQAWCSACEEVFMAVRR